MITPSRRVRRAVNSAPSAHQSPTPRQPSCEGPTRSQAPARVFGAAGLFSSGSRGRRPTVLSSAKNCSVRCRKTSPTEVFNNERVSCVIDANEIDPQLTLAALTKARYLGAPIGELKRLW